MQHSHSNANNHMCIPQCCCQSRWKAGAEERTENPRVGSLSLLLDKCLFSPFMRNPRAFAEVHSHWTQASVVEAAGLYAETSSHGFRHGQLPKCGFYYVEQHNYTSPVLTCVLTNHRQASSRTDKTRSAYTPCCCNGGCSLSDAISATRPTGIVCFLGCGTAKIEDAYQENVVVDGLGYTNHRADNPS